MKFIISCICHTRRSVLADYMKERSNRTIQKRNCLPEVGVASLCRSLIVEAQWPKCKMKQQGLDCRVGGLGSRCWNSSQNWNFKSGLFESNLLKLQKLSFCISLILIFWVKLWWLASSFELRTQILWVFIWISSLLLWERRGHGSDSFIYTCKPLSSGLTAIFYLLLGLIDFKTVMLWTFAIQCY